MKKTTRLGLMALLLGISFSSSVFAHDSVGFSFNIGRPYYYEPPPVYYAPPPVIYSEPRPVYREYYSSNYYYPRADRYYDNDGWRRHEHRGHREHHEHDDDD